MSQHPGRHSCRWSAYAVVLLCVLTQRGYARDVPYLARLADRTAAWRERLADMKASAQRAAKGVIAGGNLYAYDFRRAFDTEACNRAGGLMLMRYYDRDRALNPTDTILAAVSGGHIDSELSRLIDQAGAAGSQVILFGDGVERPDADGVIVFTWPNEPGLSIESMSNVVGMWSWTGQFIAACVDQGQMPCVYESYSMPGGRERAAFLKQFNDGRFHRSTLVRPQDARNIAANYLNAVESALRDTWTEGRSVFEQAAAAIRTARRADGRVAVYSLGHLFPAEFDQPQQADWLVPVKRTDRHGDAVAVIMLEYQATPWELLGTLSESTVPIILTCSQPPPAEFLNRPNSFYMNPHWPSTDAIVPLPGYDVAVLPASGVLDAAVYWQLVELVEASIRADNPVRD